MLDPLAHYVRGRNNIFRNPISPIEQISHCYQILKISLPFFSSNKKHRQMVPWKGFSSRSPGFRAKFTSLFDEMKYLWTRNYLNLFAYLRIQEQRSKRSNRWFNYERIFPLRRMMRNSVIKFSYEFSSFEYVERRRDSLTSLARFLKGLLLIPKNAFVIVLLHAFQLKSRTAHSSGPINSATSAPHT